MRFTVPTSKENATHTQVLGLPRKEPREKDEFCFPRS